MTYVTEEGKERSWSGEIGLGVSSDSNTHHMGHEDILKSHQKGYRLPPIDFSVDTNNKQLPFALQTVPFNSFYLESSRLTVPSKPCVARTEETTPSSTSQITDKCLKPTIKNITAISATPLEYSKAGMTFYEEKLKEELKSKSDAVESLTHDLNLSKKELNNLKQNLHSCLFQFSDDKEALESPVRERKISTLWNPMISSAEEVDEIDNSKTLTTISPCTERTEGWKRWDEVVQEKYPHFDANTSPLYTVYFNNFKKRHSIPVHYLEREDSKKCGGIPLKLHAKFMELFELAFVPNSCSEEVSSSETPKTSELSEVSSQGTGSSVDEDYPKAMVWKEAVKKGYPTFRTDSTTEKRIRHCLLNFLQQNCEKFELDYLAYLPNRTPVRQYMIPEIMFDTFITWFKCQEKLEFRNYSTKRKASTSDDSDPSKRSKLALSKPSKAVQLLNLSVTEPYCKLRLTRYNVFVSKIPTGRTLSRLQRKILKKEVRVWLMIKVGDEFPYCVMDSINGKRIKRTYGIPERIASDFENWLPLHINVIRSM
ncbi:hypothetical protein HDV02_005577 [Globomyces sp. JEL0801]|nr:hypothetical protein HDV02_005577 [Globomyces sp. JEL0801]